MKKFILGVGCGLVIASSSVVFASDAVQALLFPASFEINGRGVDVGNEYHVLNVDGHAYVPVRFVAENLGATIDYDTDENKIIIKNKPLELTDPDYKGISVGNVIVTKNGGNTKVTGQLKFEGVGNSQNMIGANLSFYNGDNVKIGEVPITGNDFGVEARTFVVEGKGDFKDYAEAYLHIGAVNHRIIPEAAHVEYRDAMAHYAIDLPASWEGNYEVEERMNEDLQRVSYQFIEKANKAYGGVVFSIAVYTKEDWAQNGPTTMGNGRAYKLGEDMDRIFVLFPPGDVEYNVQDEKLTASYQSMTDQISKIRRSFRMVK